MDENEMIDPRTASGDALGIVSTRERIDQSLNITGSILDATVEVNDTTIRDEALAGELDTARTAVARARELVLPEPAQSYRFRIDWWTTILDKDVTDTEVVGRYPVRGYSIVLTETIEDAKEVADSMCDVDFFAPYEHYSASSHEVVGGVMWQERTGMDPATGSGQSATYMGDLLPDVETWNFDDVKILDVQPYPQEVSD